MKSNKLTDKQVRYIREAIGVGLEQAIGKPEDYSTYTTTTTSSEGTSLTEKNILDAWEKMKKGETSQWHKEYPTFPPEFREKFAKWIEEANSEYNPIVYAYNKIVEKIIGNIFI